MNVKKAIEERDRRRQAEDEKIRLEEIEQCKLITKDVNKQIDKVINEMTILMRNADLFRSRTGKQRRMESRLEMVKRMVSSMQVGLRKLALNERDINMEN